MSTIVKGVNSVTHETQSPLLTISDALQAMPRPDLIALSEQTGVSLSTLYLLRNNTGNPSLSNLLAVAQALGYHLSFHR